MDHYETFAANCQATIENLTMAVDALAPPLSAAAQTIGACLLQDGKVMACGEGADAALAHLFCANMLGHFLRERPALPAMALTGDGAILAAIAGQDGPREMYARQLHALGQAGDVLLCIASGPAPTSVLVAVQAAAERNMAVVALSNRGDEGLAAILRPGDIRIAVDNPHSARVLELHTIVLQNLCELIDHSLFGGYPGIDT